MTKEYVPKKIQRNDKGRRIAIGDIHGCYFTFEHLLKEVIQITKDDQIFLLGDLIGKGLNSSLVLDLVNDLKRKDYQVFPIKRKSRRKIIGSL